MGQFIFPQAVFSALLMLGFVVTVPLHELFHFLFLKIAGIRGNITIRWFQIPSSNGVMGYVKIQDEVTPVFWKNHRKLFYFLLGFSGSAGVALSILGGVLKFSQHLTSSYFTLLTSMIILHSFYATWEGVALTLRKGRKTNGI